MKKYFVILLVPFVAVALTGGNGLFAASPSGTSLALEVRPDAYIETSSVPASTTAGDIQSLTISLKVIVRLNKGTDGRLSISTRGIQTNENSAWSLETAAGSQQISDIPVWVRSYSHSGSYADSVVIHRDIIQGSMPNENELPGALIITLTTSDGTAAWTQTASLPSAAPPAQ